MGLSEAEFERIKENQRLAQGKPLPPKRAAKSGEAMSEKDLEQKCTQMLIQDGWRALKTNPVSRRAHGKGFGELGMADYLYIRYKPRCSDPDHHSRTDLYCSPRQADVMWIEWKRIGGKAEDHQTYWHKEERDRGALVLLAGVDFPSTPEGFWDWYNKSGLRRTDVLG